MSLISKSFKKKNHNKPFFSIITVVKNDEKNIKTTIESIIGQTYKNYEYIVIDGKSNDQTLKQISKYIKHIDYFISKKDKGIYFAMNKGAKLANGDVIVFVNSGDKLFSNALRIIKKKFAQNKNIGFVFGTVKRNYTKNTVIKYGYNKERLRFNFDFATSHSTGFFLKRKIFIKLGLFNTKYKYSSDYDLYYRLIIKNKIPGASTSKSSLIGEMASGGFSSKIPFFYHLLEESKIRINNKQNFILVIIIFLNAIVKHFLKRLLFK